jgi:hypothetical protein
MIKFFVRLAIKLGIGYAILQGAMHYGPPQVKEGLAITQDFDLEAVMTKVADVLKRR